MPGWDEHQKFESDWWGDCANTYGEETKQLTYAHRMGLRIVSAWQWPVYDLEGRSVLDLGGGPTSMLLKTRNLGRGLVVDPCSYPSWVRDRYEGHSIGYQVQTAESYMGTEVFDECWIYNVLQHVQDPEAVITAARRSAKLLRIFDWINLPPHLGHPHELRAPKLDQWIGGKGTIEQMDENGCNSIAYYGAFPL